MKIHIQKLGILENTDFELRKGLTLLVGQNQTGKSYLNYLINAIFDWRFTESMRKIIREAEFPIFREWTNQMIKEGSVVLSDEGLNYFTSRCEDILKINHINRGFYGGRSFFEWIYKLNAESVKDWLVEIEYTVEKSFLNHFKETLKRETRPHSLELEINVNSSGIITIDDRLRSIRNSHEGLQEEIYDQIKRLFIAYLDYYFMPLHFEVAERAGYIPHISFLTNALIDERERATLMPHIVQYIQNQNRLSNNIFQGHYHQIANKYSLQIMRGRIIQMQNAPLMFEYGVVEGGELKDAKQLYVHAAASTVKSLAGLFMFLRSEARPGDVILIDEPEIHLHPDNQIWVARMLAELVNAGLNIIVSTHSVIILQELNNLVRLGATENLTEEQIEQQTDIQREFGYTPGMCLTPDQLHPYLFRFRDESKRDSAEIVPLNVNWEGIDQVQSISKSLYQLNKSVYRIYDELVRPRSAQEDDED